MESRKKNNTSSSSSSLMESATWSIAILLKLIVRLIQIKLNIWNKLFHSTSTSSNETNWLKRSNSDYCSQSNQFSRLNNEGWQTRVESKLDSKGDILNQHQMKCGPASKTVNNSRCSGWTTYAQLAWSANRTNKRLRRTSHHAQCSYLEIIDCY